MIFCPPAPAPGNRATPEQIDEMKRLMDAGFRQGAVAAGFGMVYTPAASRWEILEMFRLAAKYRASCHVHLRGGSTGTTSEPEAGLEEVISAAAVTGAPLQVVHINSSSRNRAPQMLQILREARARGLDVTTEMYPYIAGCTRIESASFDDWMDRPESAYQSLQWMATGERLTRESFPEISQAGRQRHHVYQHGGHDRVQRPRSAADDRQRWVRVRDGHQSSAERRNVFPHPWRIRPREEADDDRGGDSQDDAGAGPAPGGARSGDEEERAGSRRALTPT